MSFLKGLFGKKKKETIEPMRGGAVIQSQAEQDVTRERMESEMAGQRTKRDDASKEHDPEPSKDSQ